MHRGDRKAMVSAGRQEPQERNSHVIDCGRAAQG
jgi:hypothetical protein